MALSVAGLFEREDHLVAAAAAARADGLTIIDAYAPYPVHGLSTAMGLRDSRLTRVCLAFGLVAGVAMLAFQHWASAVDWPINVGGRPWNSFPAFVPVTFEAIVFAAALGTVAVFIAVAGLHPWRAEHVPHPRVTDDRFALVLAARTADERQRAGDLLSRFHAVSVEARDE